MARGLRPAGTSWAQQIGVTRAAASRTGAKAIRPDTPKPDGNPAAAAPARRPTRRVRCRGPGLAPLGRARGTAPNDGLRNPLHLGLDLVGTEPPALPAPRGP